MKWLKLFTNLVANASSAILGMTPRAIFSDPQLFRFEREMLRECLRVMRAGRIPVTDLPGTPVRLLALAVQRLPHALAQPVLARAVGGGRGGKMPSFYLDFNLRTRKNRSGMVERRGGADRRAARGRYAGQPAAYRYGKPAGAGSFPADRIPRKTGSFNRSSGIPTTSFTINHREYRDIPGELFDPPDGQTYNMKQMKKSARCARLP